MTSLDTHKYQVYLRLNLNDFSNETITFYGDKYEITITVKITITGTVTRTI